MIYSKKNLTGKSLKDTEGYPTFTDEKAYQIEWSERGANYSNTGFYKTTLGKEQFTAGFWEFDRTKTRILDGFTTSDNTKAVLVVDKSSGSLGSVTTNIKEGGSIKGMVGYKASSVNE